jgi:DNA polymerase III delta subunit
VAKEADPRAELARFAQGLERGLAPGYALRGEERWFVARALDALRARAEAAALEVCRHDAAEQAFSLSSLLDDLCGQALFASGRLVLVESADSQELRTAGAKDGALTRAVTSFLLGARGTVALVGTGLRADQAVVRAIAAAGGGTFSFRALYDSPPAWAPDPAQSELAQWLSARARERGLRLTADQALLLTKAKGNDLAALDSELVRLQAGGEGAGANVELDAAGSPTRLADLMLDGNAPEALFEIERLWRGGFAKGKGAGRETSAAAILAVLFASLRRGVRQGLAGAAAVARGASPPQAADAAGVPAWPKARQAFQARLGARGAERWRAMQLELVELERRSRSGVEVDSSDLAALALRWRADPRRAAAEVRR